MKNHDFPKELLKDIYEFEKMPSKFPDDIAGTLLYEICNLEKRKRDMILRYYITEDTQEMIAQSYGLSKSRAGQLIHLAVRELRHKLANEHKLLNTGIKKYAEMRFKQAKEEYYRQGVKDAQNNCVSEEPAKIVILPDKDIEISKIDGFSIRTRNALKSSGYKTLYQIIKGGRELLKSKSQISRKNYAEIVHVLIHQFNQPFNNWLD